MRLEFPACPASRGFDSRRRKIQMPSGKPGGICILVADACRYVSRMVNLTTLAPDIVVAILDDALPDDMTLFDLAVGPATLWEGQLNFIKGRS